MAINRDNFSVSSLPIINIETVSELTDTHRNLIYHYITESGFVVIQESSSSDPGISLTVLARLFGPVIFHNMSDEQGVFPMCYMPGYNEYANATCRDVALHTDGAFELNSPKLILLHCEQPDISGGNTLLAFAEDLYAHLQKHFPSAINGLFLKDAFTVKRDDREAANAVFNKVNGNIQTTFRSGTDVQITVNKTAENGYKEICKYLENPANYIEFHLEKNQTLIIDNTRILHGRTRFPESSSRKLSGIWCDADNNNPLFSLGFENKFCQ